ncbi:MAG: hypothetical protein L0Y76_06565 [Ignavibacteria bacterium]|nr:hypothetical protein [Ignavibacteria bacterium]
MNELINLIKELSKANIKFVVCGGVACVLQGVERTTFDLDVSLDLSEDNLLKVIKLSKEYGLVPRIPEPVENLLDKEKRKTWVQQKNALVYTFNIKNTALQLDIFLDYPFSYSELMSSAEKIDIEGVEIYISSKKDLLAAKNSMTEKRDKDLLDIKELKKLLDGN